MTRVEDEKRREPAVGQASVQLEIRTLRPRHSHRHVFVESLIAGGALRESSLVAWILLVDAAGVVVLDLVIVPRDDPRERRMCALEIAIGLVLGVAVAVVGEGEAPAAFAVVPNDVAARGPLVDVVAEEEHSLQILARQVGVRRVVALGVVLARREREPEALGRGHGGRGASTPERTLCAACAEAIPVHAIRLESTHLDVHRMREIRCRGVDAGAHDVFHGLVARDEPLDVNGAARHAAA